MFKLNMFPLIDTFCTNFTLKNLEETPSLSSITTVFKDTVCHETLIHVQKDIFLLRWMHHFETSSSTNTQIKYNLYIIYH